MLYFPFRNFCSLISSLVLPWSFSLAQPVPSHQLNSLLDLLLSGFRLVGAAAPCWGSCQPSQGRWRERPPLRGAAEGRPAVVTWQVPPDVLFSKENDPQDCQFPFLFWTKLLIILQNIPKWCFVSSKCQIPVLPESANDLCSSQLPWYQGTTENNMLIEDNENSYPDRIFQWKLMLAVCSQQFSCWVSSHLTIYDSFLYTSVS